MSFKKITPPMPPELAMSNPIDGVCDYRPDIFTSIDYLDRKEAEVSDPHIGQYIIALQDLLPRMLKDYDSVPLFPPAELASKILGVFAMAKLVQHPRIFSPQKGDSTISIAEYKEQDSPQVGIKIFDLGEFSAPRVHLQKEDARKLGLVLPKKGKREVWSADPEWESLILKITQSAQTTPLIERQFTDQEIAFEPRDYVSVYPTMRAKSTPETHRCPIPRIGILLI